MEYIVIVSGFAWLFVLFSIAPRLTLFVLCLPFLIFVIMLFTPAKNSVSCYMPKGLSSDERPWEAYADPIPKIFGTAAECHKAGGKTAQEVGR